MIPANYNKGVASISMVVSLLGILIVAEFGLGYFFIKNKEEIEKNGGIATDKYLTPEEITNTIEPELFITKSKTTPPKTFVELDFICNKDENKPNQNKYYRFIGTTFTPDLQYFSPAYSGKNELHIKLPDGSVHAIQRYGYSAGGGSLNLPLHYRQTFVDSNNLANENNFNVYGDLVIFDGPEPAVRTGGGFKFKTPTIQEAPILCGSVVKSDKSIINRIFPQE